GPILDHSSDTLLAPGRRPPHPLDVAQRVRAQILLIHADEPLRRGAEDQRTLVSPAVRVAVAIGLVMPEPASMSTGLASSTLRPATRGVSGRKRPSPPTGLSTARPYRWPTMKSSNPCPG